MHAKWKAVITRFLVSTQLYNIKPKISPKQPFHSVYIFRKIDVIFLLLHALFTEPVIIIYEIVKKKLVAEN